MRIDSPPERALRAVIGACPPGRERARLWARYAVLCALTVGPAMPAVAADLAACSAWFEIPPRPQADGALLAGEVELNADEAELTEGGDSLLKGNVHVRRGPMQLASAKLAFNQETEIARSLGEVQIWDEGFYLIGEDGTMDLRNQLTTVEGARYKLASSIAHGQADRFVREGDRKLSGEGATYSTCDPAEPVWVLHAESIEFDRDAQIGAARDVWVELGRLPIFYSPVVTFSLSDKRKSGFLSPKLRVSESTGVDFTQPYYLNLAPNRDATVALRATSRGVQAQGEFRYLQSFGAGTFAAEHLPNDSKYESSRTAVYMLHRGHLDDAKRWSSEVNFSWVSDGEYFEDLGTNLGMASRLHLERRADLNYSGNGWSALARVQAYQNLDESIAADPYERLPQLLLSTNIRERNRKFNLSGTAEAVHFDRSSGVIGRRLHFTPAVSFPMRSAGAYLVPKATLLFSAYSLDDQPAGSDDSPTRLLPRLELDSGLNLEKSFALGDDSFTHTLEPRLKYLLVPYEDQSQLPVFDTGTYTFSYAQMFREGRFNGADRIGDANQVAIGLTSRLLTSSGAEMVRGSIGQTRYFRDRRVALGAGAPETRNGSDIVGEIDFNIVREWRVSGNMQWNPDTRRTSKQDVSVRYQPTPGKVMNLAYRFSGDGITDEPLAEQVDLSFGWPLSPNLSIVGRWNKALNDNTLLEAFAGLEYDGCCWAARAMLRRYLTGAGDNHENSVYFQLELKGLTGIGAGRTVDFLERSIPGYQNRF